MATKQPIKIIKRKERAIQDSNAEEKDAPKKTAQETAREMVATVTEWVTEFQQKRRTETSQALKTLFTETTPQPSKA